MPELGNNWPPRQEQPFFQYKPGKTYLLLKQIFFSFVIFSIVYLASISETDVGTLLVDHVRYFLITNTDKDAVIGQIRRYMPPELEQTVITKIHTIAFKPNPFMYMSKPLNGKIITQYGWQENQANKQAMMHDGIVIQGEAGETIRTSAAGKIKAITDSIPHGKIVIVAHSDTLDTVYGHLGEILVVQGEPVSQGQIIARLAANTDKKATTGLYFEIRENGNPIDPLTRLKGELSEERK